MHLWTLGRKQTGGLFLLRISPLLTAFVSVLNCLKYPLLLFYDQFTCTKKELLFYYTIPVQNQVFSRRNAPTLCRDGA